MTVTMCPSEQMLFTTIRIECEAAGKSSVGTGFFFAFRNGEESMLPLIITNRHVVAGAGRATIRLTKAGPDGSPLIGQFLDVDCSDFSEGWIDHPDPSVDLCVLPIASLLQAAVDSKEPCFIRCLDPSIIPYQEELANLNPLEEIVMIGYPAGLWDSKNNLPILRRGDLLDTVVIPGLSLFNHLGGEMRIVPEPASLLLNGTALLALAALAVRRRGGA